MLQQQVRSFSASQLGILTALFLSGLIPSISPIGLMDRRALGNNSFYRLDGRSEAGTFRVKLTATLQQLAENRLVINRLRGHVASFLVKLGGLRPEAR